MSTQPRSVVVGADDSEGSRSALMWAADEARRRHLPLRVVHAVPLALFTAERRGFGAVLPEGLLEAAQQVLDEAAEFVRSKAPDVETAAQLYDELDEAAALVHEGRSAELIVLGAHGRGGFAGLLTGSTSITVATHAACPVVVVRPSSGASGPSVGRVVVGVDGSEESQAAVEFAFAEASLRGVGLTAVHAWSRVFTSARTPLPLLDWSAVAEGEAELLAEALAGMQEKYPDVDVRRSVVEGHPGGALVDESAGAELLVVSSRGRGGFAGLLLGSVSQSALQHANCPVAIVRPYPTTSNGS